MAIDPLLRVTKDDTTAIMCAEILPWKCHRALIADALVVRGIEVEHIMTLTGRKKTHSDEMGSCRGHAGYLS